MSKINIPALNMDYYKDILDNGLTVYTIPNHNTDNYTCVYFVKFGDYFSEFVPYNGKEYKKHHLGIAHFLEHKMFEQEDGSSAHIYFSQHTLYSNAVTNSDKTKYYFVARKYQQENINYLLDMVDNLYLTKENVEKEKGIILSEQRMDANNTSRIIFNYINHMLLKTYPTLDCIIGSPDDIKNISKEELEECYKTFYNPNNMAFFIAGDVNHDDVLKIINDNQIPKNRHNYKIDAKKHDEPEEVVIKKDSIKLFINVPETYCLFKVKIPKKYQSNYLTAYYFNYIVDLLTNDLYGYSQNLIDKKIIDRPLSVRSYRCDDYKIFAISTNTSDEEKFVNEITRKINNLNDDEESYDLYRQNAINGAIKSSDNNSSMTGMIMEAYYWLGDFDPNFMQEIIDSKRKDFLQFYKSLSFKNSAVLTVLPKSK
jgi:predicted Zn-dependent peptidase